MTERQRRPTLHLPPRGALPRDVATAVHRLVGRVAALEREVAALKAAAGDDEGGGEGD